jgi:ParB-like chromosome segregation protein Spo0J
MLVFADLPLELISLRHDRPDLVAWVKSKPQYGETFNSIQRNGILDPCLVRRMKDTYQMETGGQRLLIARELGIKSLKSFVYDFSGEIDCEYLVRIKSPEQVREFFRHEQVAAYLDIMGFINSGVIKLT